MPFDTRGLKVAEIAKENLVLVHNKSDQQSLRATDLDDLNLSRLMLLEEGQFLRDHVLNGDIELIFIDINHQLTDIFTKPLNKERFNFIRLELGMLDESSMH